ncbi:MAG: (Fe-S)-binding protein [Candidatus Nanoarchaeia archaeon]
MFRGILSKLTSGNTLYYPGCLTKFVLKDVEENYKKILNQLKIDFIMLGEMEFCCGSPVLNAGYEEEYKELVQKNREVLKKYGIGKIITNCPACYKVLKENYPEIKVEHVTQTIWKNIEKLKLKSFNEKITYHDPCHLGRHSGVYDEPRYILKALDFEVVEINNNRENSMCCGGGAGLRTNAPNTSSKIAKMLGEHIKTDKVITTCPLCYVQLKENTNKEVLEMSQVLV